VIAFNTSARKVFAPVVCAGFLMLLAPVSGAFAQDCQSALDGTSGFTTLNNGDSTSEENAVVEWDGEVLKLRTNLSGVLTINATGSTSQGSLYTDGTTSTHPLVDSASIGTSQQDLTAIVGAGDHCVQLAPGVGASGDIELSASFVDVCHLGTPDDHGNSFVCATPITVGGSAASGEITSTETVDDVDMFVFTLSSSATVTIASSEGEYVGGSLYNSSGSLITSDNTGWSAANFSISNQSLAAGTYYIKVTGPDDANYGLSVTSAP
jgi:hypothetical protein